MLALLAIASEDIIIQVQEEEEPVVCLLDRLKCPRESRKRKVQTNPCKGVKRSKGATSFEPQKVSFSSRIKKKQHLSTNKGKLFCDACREFLYLKKV